jgi:hypothetical protein
MSVNDFERTDKVFGLEYMVHERPAHVVDLVNKVRVQVERTSMVVHAVNARVIALTRSHSRKNVHFVTLPFQGRRKFSDMGTHSADRNGVQ